MPSVDSSSDTSSILSSYYSLSSLDEQERLKANQTIVEYVSENPSETEYALKRLSRGVYSHNKAARQGFSSCLTSLLTVNKSLQLADLLQFNENMKKQKLDEKSIFFGTIFCYSAYIESGLILTSSWETLSQMLTEIVSLSSKKSYLSTLCTRVLISLLQKISSHTDTNVQHKTLEFIATTLQVITTPDQLYLALVFQQLYPEQSINAFKSLENWKMPLIHTKNLNHITDLLKQASEFSPQLHPVWETLLQSLLKAESNGSSKVIRITSLWQELDPLLFSTTPERKCTGFHVFNLLLKSCIPDQLPLVFSHNFLRCLINNLSKKNTLLHKHASSTALYISKIALEKSNIALPLVMQLIGKHGNLQFDRLTKTKTVETIIRQLKAEQLTDYIEKLTHMYYSPSGFSSHENTRKWVVEQFALIVRNTTYLSQNETNLKAIFEFMLLHCFFEIKKVYSNTIKPLDVEVSEKYLSFFTEKTLAILSSLSTLSIKSHEGEKARSSAGIMTDGTTWSYHALCVIQKAHMNADVFEPRFKDKEEVQQAFDLCVQIVKSIADKLKGTKSTCKEYQESFHLLFSNVAIGVSCDLIEPSSVEDLQQCYEQFSMSRTKRKHPESEQETPNPITVLMDILISFMAKPSHWLRSLSCSTFKSFMPLIGKDCLDLIFDVLNAKAGADGANELFDDEEVEQEEEAQEKPERAANSFHMLENVDEAVSDASPESSSEEGETENENESDSDDEEVNEDDPLAPVDEDLKRKITEALGDAAAINTDDELSDLGDEDMADFDEKLADIFKHRKEVKTVQKETKQQVLHFKLRVLDLIEVLFKSSSFSSTCLDAIKPMLEQVMKTRNSQDEKVLHDRLVALLNGRLVKGKDATLFSSIDPSSLVSVIEFIHNLSRKPAFNTKLSALLSSLSLFLTKIGCQLTSATDNDHSAASKKLKQGKTASKKELKSCIDQIVNVYGASFHAFVHDKKTGLKPAFFTDLAQRYPHVAVKLLPRIADELSANGMMKSYSFVQATHIAFSVLKMTAITSEFSHSNLVSFVKSFGKVSVIALQEANKETSPTSGPFAWSNDRVKELLKNITSIVKRTLKLDTTDDIKSTWKELQMSSVLDSFLASTRFGNTHFIKSFHTEWSKLL